MAQKHKEKQSPPAEPESAENDAAPEASGAEETVRAECEELLANKEDEIKQLQDRVLRLAAEMENTRKRLERERTDGICFANESLIREMLPVMDNLERAIDHGEKEGDGENLLEGVRMTAKSFMDVLAKFGCVPFESVGKPFDPKFHEAIMQQPSPDQPENTVIQEFQKGYTIHDRLLRPAMVVVSKG
jgi:molecular chaperone GrpE